MSVCAGYRINEGCGEGCNLWAELARLRQELEKMRDERDAEQRRRLTWMEDCREMEDERDRDSEKVGRLRQELEKAREEGRRERR